MGRDDLKIYYVCLFIKINVLELQDLLFSCDRLTSSQYSTSEGRDSEKTQEDEQLFGFFQVVSKNMTLQTLSKLQAYTYHSYNVYRPNHPPANLQVCKLMCVTI